MSDLSTLRQHILAYTPACPEEEQDRRLMLDFIRRNPDCLLRSCPAAHFTASSWILDESGQQTLLVYHNIYKAWSWTGGHADGESDLLAVALREAREETGLARIEPVRTEPLSLEVITVEGHWKQGRYVSAHLHLNLTYLLRADAGQPLRACPGENQAVGWVARSQVAAISGEAKMIPIYEKLNQRATEILSRF